MNIGILGAGQLARMLALAGFPLGHAFAFLDPQPDPCAAPLGRHLAAPYTDANALKELGSWADVVTYEFENIPAQALHILAEATVHPQPAALFHSQDRLQEKRLFTALGIRTTIFQAVDSADDLPRAAAAVGLPAVLKTRRLGYDGKGQAVVRRPEDLQPAWEAIGCQSAILENLVPFTREIAITAVRHPNGGTVFYPISENIHAHGILRLSLARPQDPIQAQAEAAAQKMLTHLNYVGSLTIEFFQHHQTLIANEWAPRVHNSAHWTIEGAETSQFSNHLRAITGSPLGVATPRGYAAMVNCIGELPAPEKLLAIPGAHVHIYGKAPRPDRKLGHVTLRADTPAALHRSLVQALEIVAQTDPLMHHVLHQIQK